MFKNICPICALTLTLDFISYTCDTKEDHTFYFFPNVRAVISYPFLFLRYDFIKNMLDIYARNDRFSIEIREFSSYQKEDILQFVEMLKFYA